jgi:hypothetical protein
VILSKSQFGFLTVICGHETNIRGAWKRNPARRLQIYDQKKARARICERSRRPRINSKESIPPAYVALRARLGIDPPGLLKGLQIRALL